MQPQDDIRPGLLRRRVIFVALAVLIEPALPKLLRSLVAMGAHFSTSAEA